MADIKLKSSGLEALHEMNPRLISYNVEMTSVTAEGTLEIAPGSCTFIIL